MKTAKLKNFLLTEGLRVEVEVESRKGGAGPTGSYLIFGDSIVNFAINPESPLKLVRREDGYFIIAEEEIPVELPPKPKFHEELYEGIPMKMIARRHGKDVLASTVLQKCILKDLGKGCKFCGIELSLKSGDTVEMKLPEMLAEVSRTAKKYGDATHVTLTTGKFEDEREEIITMSKVSEAVNDASGMPVHVQITPPQNVELLEELKCDTLGIHIESFDESVLKKVAPGKFEMRERFEIVLKKAVDIFGESQVSTFVILGLGEDEMRTVEGCRRLLELGVIPYLVPFRKIRGTEMENYSQPSPEYTERVLIRVAEMMKNFGVDPRRNKAGCVKCGGCSAIGEYLREV
jgi:radical SAM protein (TIGR04043 family)